MKRKWNYQDCIDLEYFFHKDIDELPEYLHTRDRNIFIKKWQGSDTGSINHRELVSFWLEDRLHREFSGEENRSPGEIFRDSLSLLKGICAIAGTFIGITAGLSFFTYSGTTPVNVFHFILFFVLSQIVLTLLLGSSLFLRGIKGKIVLPSFYILLFGKLFRKIILLVSKQWQKNLSADKRQSVTYVLGLINAHNRVYGSLFYWPLFTLSQILALFFNTGLLAATLLKISTSDLAFGWQSTLQFSGSSLHKLVTFLALPWSWFIPQSFAFPSLEEIEGSRILLKEGIYLLATENLVSWWPFLVLCLLFYGLFFRIVCFLIGRWMEKRSLRKIKFNSASCRNLVQRMQTPLVSTQAQPEEQQEANDRASVAPPLQPTAGNSLFPQFVFIPDDIYNESALKYINELLQCNGFSVKETVKFMSDYDTDQKIKETLRQRRWDDDTGLLILMEGWMVPLVGFISYIKELRYAIPRETLITIALVGRPCAAMFTDISHNDYTIWQKKIHALGDPYLCLLALNPIKKISSDNDF